jgi:hypothetical protein
VLIITVVLVLASGASAQSNYRTLHRFTGAADGIWSASGLIFDRSGNLYGTAAWGGNLNYCTGNRLPGGCGVVFKLAPNSKGGWNELVLHRLLNDQGTHPVAGVIFDAAGNLYGTAQGGMTNFGSVFEIMP